MNWNLSDFLLPSIKPTFDEVVVTYLNILWSQMKKEYGDPSTPRIRRITDSQSQPELTPCGTSETLENFAKELVSKEMPIELFGSVTFVLRVPKLQYETPINVSFLN